MGALLRGIAAVLIFAGLAALGFFGARHWQAAEPTHQRLAGPSDCDLRAGPCVQPLHDGRVWLSISPARIPLMKTLVLEVRPEGLEVDAVVVDIRGLNMDMGLNRTTLKSFDDHVWRGETILPVCSQRRMQWEAAVQIDIGDRFEIPFEFETTRP